VIGMIIADFSQDCENYSDIEQHGGTIALVQAFYGSDRARVITLD